MLGFASLITLGIIFGFIFVILFLIAYFGGYMDITLVIGLTVGVNFLMWLISPAIMDLMFRWFYKIKRLEITELEQKSKRLAGFIKRTCEKYNMKLPQLRYIEDDNPTAFAFGSGVFNARLCFSEGLFVYLTEEEIEAVLGHELGHIRRRDFIIMTIAATGVQVLYELSQMLMRSGRRGGRSKDKNPLPAIGLLAYIFYFVGLYLLLFLSRTREYGADAFAAHETQNPDALARALVKIAYGIVAKPDDQSQKRLLSATRALGPYDPQAARHLGTAFQSTHEDWQVITKVIAYDLVSPWAKIMELQSTHPLTGRRIVRLNEFSKKMGKKPSIETDSIASMQIDRGRLYHGFFLGVFIHFLPWIAPLALLIIAVVYQKSFLSVGTPLLWIPGAFGLALLLRILYKYPSGEPQKTTTLEMMTDLYASPVRGHLYALEGKVIGRGTAGAKLAEDMMLQDSKGLIYLNYESAFSFIGNLIFALGKVKKLVGRSVSATGWFFRDVGHHLDLKTIASGEETINSHPKLWGMVSAFILIGTSLYLMYQSGGNSFGSLGF